MRKRLLFLQAKGFDNLRAAELDEWARLRGYWPLFRDVADEPDENMTGEERVL